MTGPGAPSSDAKTERIDVCICTFRRANLIGAAIESAARQELPSGVAVRVIVADNDEQPDAERIVRETAARLGADLRYVHAPAANISIARNACIEAADSEWFAFIDDDETAASDWLARLLAARDGVDVVFGAAKAVYSPNAPAWMVRGDYHSNILAPDRPIKTGYTSNVLIRRACVGDLRFDPALGLSGGEDTIFFYALRLAGAKLRAEPAARVYEEVGDRRENLGWILRRRYRAGQTHAHLTARFHPRTLPLVAMLAVAKSGYSAILALLCAPFPTPRIRNFVRAVFHLGVVAYSVRGKFYLEYRRT